MRTSRSILRASLLVGTLAAVSPALAFTQAPSLNDQVAAGTLPPVDKRLPEKPFVQKVVGKIGVYGGNFRGFALGDADKWSLYKTGLSGGLVARGFREMKTISKNGMDGWSPAIAETWTWDDGATGLTIHLRKGVKWSDGAPLTADDIVWTWNNVQMNKGYQPSVPAQFVVAGKPMEVTKVDDVTVHFKFAGPYPWFLAALYSGSLQPFGQILAPKHYLEKFSPESNPQSTWKDFQKVYTLANPDLPTASPWMLKKYDSATEAVLVRNPYYWAVDAEGHQLPYIDTMTFAMLGSQEAAVLRGMSGQIDLGERNFQVLQNLPLLKKSEDKGAYKIALTTGDNFTNGNEIWFNYALADRASPLRDLLRTATFRNALSLAIDRNAINQSLYLGLAKPAAIGLSTKSPYWSEEMAKIAKINAQFDAKKAGALLDQLGLKDTNGDGIREYPDGKGNVTVVLGAASEINAHVNFAEMVVNYWRKVGLDARVGVQTRQALFTGVTDASFNAVVWGTTSVVYPEFRTTEGVITASYQVGPSQVKDPPEDLKQLWDLAGQIMVSTDSKTTQALVEQSQRLRAEKSLGVFSANDVPLVIIVSNRLKNVPAATDVVIDDQDHLPLMPDQWYLQP